MDPSHGHDHGDAQGGDTLRTRTTDPSSVSSTSSPPSFPLPPPPTQQRRGGDDTTNDRRPSRLKVAFARPPSFPSVIWNDRRSLGASSTSTPTPHSGANATFYTEGTPPPSPTEFRSNLSSAGAGAGTGAGGGYGDYPGQGFHARPTAKLDMPYDYSYDHVAPPAPIPRNEKGWFANASAPQKKRMFWIIALVVLAVLAIAIGVGVGVGVSQSNASKGGDSDSSTEPSSTSEPSTTTTEEDPSSTTSTVPAATTTITTAPGSSLNACPSANNTVYEVPNSDKSFLRICGVDYPGGLGGTEDLATVFTASMLDCITNCAGFENCEACSWGALEGDKGDNHRCYLKRDIGTQKPTRPGWDFAIMQ